MESLIYELEEEIISFYKKKPFETFKVQLKHLLALSVIVSKATIHSKIDCLIQIWGSNDSITRVQFAEMLDFMFELALDKLALLKSKPTP